MNSEFQVTNLIMNQHTCHAINCSIKIEPNLLMCPKHWKQVPKKLQKLVWANYRSGQEIDKQPTKEYLDAANTAIQWVYAESNRLSTAEYERRYGAAYRAKFTKWPWDKINSEWARQQAQKPKT